MNHKCLIAAAILSSSLLGASPSFALPVDLGTAGDFAILTKSGVSTTGATSVVGDIAVSPINASAITGFGLVLDASTEFSTSSLVVGRIFAADYTAPTPAKLTTAISDMETAYTDAAGRAADFTGLGAGNIGGLTLTPGVYKWGTGVLIPTDVTISGGPTDVWIFQIAETLEVSSAVKVILSGGAQVKNIFWQVGGQVTLGTTSRFKGIILGQTAIVMNPGATLDGRALAQTAVTLSSNAVTLPPTVVDDFVSTGAEQIFVVPPGVNLVSIRAFGASGWSGSNPGGLGGLALGDLAVTPGESLYLDVGGEGTACTLADTPMGGGFNGGGDGQANSSTGTVGGGGGGSDVRQGGNTLAHRVLVAGGGGGSTDNGNAFGGDGGGLVGDDGGVSGMFVGGTGGSQVAGGLPGGSLGQGGDADATMTPWNGGGGGGYFGGGVSPAHSGGGGGSSYIDGVINGSTTAGQHSGDGLVEITYTMVVPACPVDPDTGCNSAARSVFELKDHPIDAKDKFRWEFQKSTSAIDKLSELGDPVLGATAYAVCVWDRTAGVASLVATLAVDAGGMCGALPCWKDTARPVGVRYTNASGNASGVVSVVGRSGIAGKGSLIVRGAGVNLPMPTPISATEIFDQDTEVVVQMRAVNSGACWESVFGTGTTRHNTATLFKAVAP